MAPSFLKHFLLLPFSVNHVNPFSIAAVTNYGKLTVLKQCKFILRFWRPTQVSLAEIKALVVLWSILEVLGENLFPWSFGFLAEFHPCSCRAEIPHLCCWLRTTPGLWRPPQSLAPPSPKPTKVGQDPLVFRISSPFSVTRFSNLLFYLPFPFLRTLVVRLGHPDNPG